MSENEAIELAAKREKHKGRSLMHKRWSAQHNSVKGWHVALVDSHAGSVLKARQRTRDEIRAGDFDAFLDAAAELLLARVAASLGPAPTTHAPMRGNSNGEG